MPEPEEQLYQQAADAMVGAQGYRMTARTRQVLAAGWWRKDGFRAAVKVAYQAGYALGRNTDQIDVTPLDSAQRQILCNACGQIHHEPRDGDVDARSLKEAAADG